ncbi:MAG: SDR family NAD(P)-dependent oxidoreductase [Myxococcota bacterium]
MSSNEGKRIFITGANGGIGAATCRALLREGAAEVVMACRSEAKGEAAREQILAETGADPERLTVYGGFDMLDPEAIRAAVAKLPNAPFDRVFLSAGGWVYSDDYQTMVSRGVTVEKTVFMNALGGHVTLAQLLNRGLLTPSARIVVMGGEGGRGVPGTPLVKPDFSDAAAFIAYAHGEGSNRPAYEPPVALGTSKLYASVWSQRLARELEGRFEVVCMSPGLTGATAGTGGLPKWKEFVFQKIAFPIMVWTGKAQWPDAAGQKCADVLSGKLGTHGDILGAPEGKALGPLVDQKPMQEAYTNVAFQDALWDLATQAVGPLEARAA